VVGKTEESGATFVREIKADRGAGILASWSEGTHNQREAKRNKDSAYEDERVVAIAQQSKNDHDSPHVDFGQECEWPCRLRG
jgi:hypothetical protein